MLHFLKDLSYVLKGRVGEKTEKERERIPAGSLPLIATITREGPGRSDRFHPVFHPNTEAQAIGQASAALSRYISMEMD